MESMGYELHDLSVQPPYRRLSSNTSEENVLEADQGPLGGQGESLHPQTAPTKTKAFDSARQTRTLLFKGFLRWIGTVISTALIVVTLRIYEGKRNFPSDQKTVFNTVIIALILGWGLNLFVSHDPAKAKRLAAHGRWLTMSQEACMESARVVRWRILAEEPHTKREADLILGIENLLNVCALGWESFNKPRILIPCLLWLLFNVLTQVLVASVSLTYTVDDGKTYSDTYLTNGTVNASNLTGYFNGYIPLRAEDNQAVAHIYGEVAPAGKNCEPYKDIEQVYNSSNDPPYFCRRTPGKQEFAYRFKEYNYHDSQRMYPFFTNRVITASSGVCFNYIELKHTLGPDLYNHMAAANYTFSNSTYNSSISIPVSSEGWTATTYIYRGTKPPHLAEVNSCGDRCMWIWAHRASVPGNDTSTFYQCPITISEVSNTTTDLQDVPNSVARVAAASIALQGRWTGPLENKIWTQYQFYAVNTPWETHFLPDERAGANMAEFALRSLATMAERNPSIRISGRVPHLGSRLQIYNHWHYVVALLACIVSVHFALLVATAWVTKSVVVTDDSFVAIARLLNGMTKEVEGKCTLLRGKPLCEAITEEQGRRRDDGEIERHEQGEGQAIEESAHASDGIVYGPVSMGGGNYVLHMGKSVKSLKQWDGGRHPDGNFF